ncbi:MAG: hypothetical protein ACE3L7_04245 [Candidatus Pristimantibacillus sp.]
MNTIPVRAFVEEVSADMKKMLIRMINTSLCNKGKQIRFRNFNNGASYVVSYEKESEDRNLVISVCRKEKYPDASLLPFLSEIFGEPSILNSKPVTNNTSFTLLIMIWNNPDMKLIVNMKDKHILQ